MTAPATNEEFLELVRRTAAADRRRLDAWLTRQTNGRTPRDPKALAVALVRDSILTEFQAKQLLCGKPENLVLGKYEVVDLLGSGTMSTVFLCRHPAMDRWVAVKLLSPNKATNPQMLRRFHREARAAATLCHPNIVHAFDFVEDDKGLFLVMEYVDGSTLRAIVANHGPLSPRRAAAYVHHSAVGLQHAHEQGMVHRDVKPGNIMVDRTGAVKVLDLGLALLLEDSTLLTQGVLGTVDFLAPEQTIDSHNLDGRADIYGLGGTLYFLLTGRPPCGEGTVAQKVLAHRSKQPLPLRSFRADVPPDLDAVLLRMLAKNPDARYPSMASVVDALAPWTREPIDPPPALEMPRWSPMARAPAPPESPAITTSELPVVPRSGLTPLQVRVPDKVRVAAAAAVPAAPSTPAPASPSAYRSKSDKQLRPLVFPNVPPSARPSDRLTNTPRPLKTGTAPTLPVAPSARPTPAPATAPPPAPVAKPARQGWGRYLGLATAVVGALVVGLVLGVMISRLRF